MKRIKVLEGKRVSLVVPEKQDIRLWYEGMNNLEITKNLVYSFGRIWYIEDEEEFYENKTKEVIGNIALNKRSYMKYCIKLSKK